MKTNDFLKIAVFVLVCCVVCCGCDGKRGNYSSTENTELETIGQVEKDDATEIDIPENTTECSLPKQTETGEIMDIEENNDGERNHTDSSDNQNVETAGSEGMSTEDTHGEKQDNEQYEATDEMQNASVEESNSSTSETSADIGLSDEIFD